MGGADGIGGVLSDPDWAKVALLIEELYTSSDALGAIFPGRSFALDGHLVGSIGEVIAAYMFGLDLQRASTLGYDAIAPDNREVEIKFTQGKSVALRHNPAHLIVLKRSRGGPVEVVYNGPGEPVWDVCGCVQSNGQRVISLSRLRVMDKSVPSGGKLPLMRAAPV